MPRHRRGWAARNPQDQLARHSPLLLSMLEPALLVLLNEKPRHGYTLLSDLAALGMGTFHPSVVYRTLREMEELAWVESTWDTTQTQGPPRRTYQLTAQGSEALLNWQLELENTNNLIAHLLDRSTTKERS